MWMNEYEIEEVRDRFNKEETPNLHEAAVKLHRLMEWTNGCSDGWPYWKLPAKAAARLMEHLHDADYQYRRGTVTDLTDAELKALLRPVKAFLTRRGEDPEKILNPPPPVYRNPLAEILSAVPDEDNPWDLTREHPDDYRDWQNEAFNGETLLGFAGWLAVKDRS